MSKRTDIHRPSAINPAEYTYIAGDYWGPTWGAVPAYLTAERARFRDHMKRTGGKFAGHDHGGTCHVCGATAFYVAKFYHPATNTYIATGCDCAEKMDMGDARAFRTMRKTMKDAREAERGKRKAEALLSDAGLSGAWAVYVAENERAAEYRAACERFSEANPEPEYRSSNGGYGIETVGAPKWTPARYEEGVIIDMVGKLIRYGSISDKAMAYLRVLLGKIAERPKVEAERAAADAAAEPIPAGADRRMIEGDVLSVKGQDTPFGFVTKMLVKADAGWKVWGTVPRSLEIARGDRVRFVAAITVSRDDPKFGFFSRPAKAEVIRQAVAA